MGTGVVAGDFTQILNDFGRTVSYKIVTKTTDPITGSETSTFASASNVTAVFFLEEHRYIWDTSGLILVGDAYLIVPTALNAKRYDQVIIDGETFYIECVKRRYVATVAMCDYCTLFKVG
jgi:hypothetical protein